MNFQQVCFMLCRQCRGLKVSAIKGTDGLIRRTYYDFTISGWDYVMHKTACHCGSTDAHLVAVD